MAEEVRAELVANIARVVVTVGEVVEAGQMVVLLESMKMEIPVLAEHGGTVAEVTVAEGDVVQEGDTLVVLT
jgi:acetyl-CoA carboxylase biotin carboxyl carrier protein